MEPRRLWSTGKKFHLTLPAIQSGAELRLGIDDVDFYVPSRVFSPRAKRRSIEAGLALAAPCDKLTVDVAARLLHNRDITVDVGVGPGLGYLDQQLYLSPDGQHEDDGEVGLFI